LKMMGVFSELERNMISQRVKSGMANAKAKGKNIGRPSGATIPKKFMEHYELYKDGKLTKTDINKLTGISRVTINKYINILENK
ncbi:recombinase family protein, partial [Romboutsia sp.]|uniref:recombinase family protein n=1 Tax=Romboutsia sp. TaxID=1965302 RepID=UPI003F39EF16